ncbi:helix-turn-helix domain-containing protein [Protaetiibacter mangrovi]|uniref:Helix-turn-helix transcriptional regulator n=1 Tax=Protaetiibacter mangrovi TaxID=2970926 RepID=A0ABT1ZG80_9MICO|nr:helix-turn-helix transcriptional regulator [Protaetiibacter mangrovi]MCS0499692.1 helix-turn-helix transcriptional regulator [Protaetiibacter mangrovi]TPX03747.1 helix-turn-helix transcriptional regulator [Schumannella luteola]
MTAGRPLGDYLRARRELIRPEEAGLPAGNGRRRVAGLRRSEVAMLAGISTEYYVKLEQGREIHPTDQVLEALSRALQLDATARSYLASLVHLPHVETGPKRELAHIRWLIDGWPLTAAVVHDRYNDIVASNALMRAIVPAYREGANSLAALLLDPEVRALYGDEWDGLTARSVALLRANSGPQPYLVRTQQLIAQLTRESPRFREVWPRNDVHGAGDGVHHLAHPRVGALSLRFARFPVLGPGEHSIFVYYAEPGTPTADALAVLAREG